MSAHPHCRFVYSPGYFCDIGAHVFPMAKFERVRAELLADEDIDEAAFLEPEEASVEDLLLTHTRKYLDDFLGLRQTLRTVSSELPISAQIVRAYRLAAGGTTLACRCALEGGAAMSISGGFHHAFPDHAEGFCYINDVAVALRRLCSDGIITRAAVVDLDVHQGNGTAFAFQTDPEVFTFSMHQENNYPLKQHSDLDEGLADGIGDEEYLELLNGHVAGILDSHKPELVIYVAGADPYEHDQLGGLGLTLEGLRRRDDCVILHCLRRKIPLAVVLAGGYAADLQDTVRIHYGTGKLLWERSRELVKGALDD